MSDDRWSRTAARLGELEERRRDAFREAVRGFVQVVIDQIAPADPLVAVELDRFERARNPEHQRLLPDTDVRALLEANGLVVVRTRSTEEQRDLAWYLDLADCEGEERERATQMAPPSPTANVGWYLAFKPQPGT